jgi:hypothetical protein
MLVIWKKKGKEDEDTELLKWSFQQQQKYID